MLKWFRQGPSPQQTAVAMIGPKSGERVLAAGHADPAFVAELAQVTGLNGQTSIACPTGTRGAFEGAASKAGVLIDVIDLPSDDPSLIPPGVTALDIVVLVVDLGRLDLDLRLSAARDAMAVLRPGGRLMLMDSPARTGIFSGRSPATMPADAVVPMLTSVGALAARALGAADGVTYYEARKAR